MEMGGRKVIKLSVRKNKRETFYQEIVLPNFNRLQQKNMCMSHIIFSLKLLFR